MWLSYATYATICSFNLCLYQANKRCLLKPNKTATNFQENYKILLWKKQELSGKCMPTFSTCLLTDYVKIAISFRPRGIVSRGEHADVLWTRWTHDIDVKTQCKNKAQITGPASSHWHIITMRKLFTVYDNVNMTFCLFDGPHRSVGWLVFFVCFITMIWCWPLSNVHAHRSW